MLPSTNTVIFVTVFVEGSTLTLSFCVFLVFFLQFLAPLLKTLDLSRGIIALAKLLADFYRLQKGLLLL